MITVSLNKSRNRIASALSKPSTTPKKRKQRRKSKKKKSGIDTREGTQYIDLTAKYIIMSFDEKVAQLNESPVSLMSEVNLLS